MKIIAYSFDAGLHCVGCTAELIGEAAYDNNLRAKDSEGNEVRPIFETDEIDLDGAPACCGDCFRVLGESIGGGNCGGPSSCDVCRALYGCGCDPDLCDCDLGYE